MFLLQIKSFTPGGRPDHRGQLRPGVSMTFCLMSVVVRILFVGDSTRLLSSVCFAALLFNILIKFIISGADVTQLEFLSEPFHVVSLSYLMNCMEVSL